jgi:hypothetical protein
MVAIGLCKNSVRAIEINDSSTSIPFMIFFLLPNALISRPAFWVAWI